MINLDTYKKKIMPLTDELKYKNIIKRHIKLTLLALFLFLCGLVSILYTLFTSFSDGPTQIGGNVYIVLVSLAALLLFYVDQKDILKKHSLNEKLYILFSFLDDELENDKVTFFSKSRFQYIVLRLVRNLFILEDNLKNKFIFPSVDSEFLLVEKIRLFIIDNIRFLYKQKKLKEIKRILKLVKDLYASSIMSELVVEKNFGKQDIEVKYIELTKLIEEGKSMYESFTHQLSWKKKFYEYIFIMFRKKWFKTAVLIFLAIGVFLVMISYKDFSYIPAIITVLSFFLNFYTWGNK
ncbi:hypothetical protein [Paenibacillus polymyxa]|uniref:hypothetical protein n=1 Tax=Paenibacillus polymyxa TaxID=1406 RepID=UPI002AB59045|nr:hypothetical protein [Paenibacillus polymyxa]MDY8023197.1 hypothetical protein [Paenibacillus polymyxa]